MRYCVVKNCENWKRKDNTNLKFFRFPNDVERRKIWINACGKPNVNHKTGTICSMHFTDDDWRLKDNLLNIPIQKRLLNANAIPTINIWRSTINIERSARSLKRASKKVVQEILKNSNQRISEEMENNSLEACHENIAAENIPKTKSVEVQTEVEINCAREFKIIELERQLYESKRENKILKGLNAQLTNLESSVRKIFTEGQISRLKNPQKKLSWAMEDISAATCLHSAGPRAYRYLYEKNFPLPGPSTLRHWAEKLNVYTESNETLVHAASSNNVDGVDIEEVYILG